MSIRYVLNVMSDDHPGIVAAVTAVVESMGGGIESCSQTVLGGFFTLIMIVTLPEEVVEERIAESICRESRFSSSQRGRHRLQVLVQRATDEHAGEPRKPTDRFVVTAFGEDRPGIVRRFSELLAGKDVNIVDLFGEVRGDQFVLIGQLEIPCDQELGMFQVDLDEIAQELNFTVRLQHENIFIATNQLRMRLSGTNP